MTKDDIRETFRQIYLTHAWGDSPRSGPGSDPKSSTIYQNILQEILNDAARKIRSVVDIGCGDWTLTSQIDWGEIRYVGIDVVPELIDELNAKYASKTVQFRCADLINDKLPEADLVVVKDVLQHLSNRSVQVFLHKLPNYRFALITNDINRKIPLRRPFGWIKVAQRPNVDIPDGSSRPLRLCAKPFRLSAVELAQYHLQYGIATYTKQVLLWEAEPCGSRQSQLPCLLANK